MSVFLDRSTHILHHSQEQARCLFHKDLISCGLGIRPPIKAY
ncbi:hypothetical protein QUA00_24110 [Microcoleus sp. T2B6]